MGEEIIIEEKINLRTGKRTKSFSDFYFVFQRK